MRVFLWSLNRLLGLFILTTPEMDHLPTVVLSTALVLPYLTLLFATLPFGLIGFVLRCLLHQLRHPYVYSYQKPVFPLSKHVPETVAITTSNICLLPEFLSRYNNMLDTAGRARTIGERFVCDDYLSAKKRDRFETIVAAKANGPSTISSKNKCDNFPKTEQYHFNWNQNTSSSAYKNSLRQRTNAANTDYMEFTRGVVTNFPQLDIVCFQETWDRDFAKILLDKIHSVFPYVVYDAGSCNSQSNLFMLNSGLMIASKFPIEDADFKWFQASTLACRFSAKGLLMVKVFLGEENGKRAVGYIYNTHLQAYEGKHLILDKQLDDIVKWTEQFRKETLKQDERVKFDFICGDFNFDNLSPGEARLQTHPIYNFYEDIPRAGPGRDHSWTVGTELRPLLLWDKAISTPMGLKRVLEDSHLCHNFVNDANIVKKTISELCHTLPQLDEHGEMKISPHIAGKRRIDRVLYRKSDCLTLKAYNFVTRLASLTDHIPVTMTIYIPSDS